ncbi:MAG: VWA domain-containing protein [Myxococcales bacterium]|nr:VWA domain-containing protein [Myxococcales bacterium]
MRFLVHTSLTTGALGVLVLGVGLGACSLGETMSRSDIAGAAASGNTTTTWTTTTSTTTGTWTGAGGAGASASFGGAGGALAVGGQGGAGAQGGLGGQGGEDACAGLDSSQPLVLYLSADDSNSMASPAHARELLNQFASPSSFLQIRTYEFLNYYRIAFPAAPQNQVALYTEGELAVPGKLDLQLAVRSYDALHPRRPMTITFVLDTSGSMGGNSIEREKAVVKAVAKSLAAGDIVSMVTWSDQQSTVLAGHVATGPNDATVVAAANGLAADGSTDLHAGLVRGYELANQYYGMTSLNRLILVSDGGANTGITDETLIANNAKDGDREGIYLVGVGTGPATGYNDLLMDTVTDRGRGAYVYVDGTAEAERLFVDRFDETMEIAARAVQVELTVPWYLSLEKFSGEQASTNPEEVEPQHLAPSDAMVFHQTLAACNPALLDPAHTVTVKVNWLQPLTYQASSTSITWTIHELLAGPKEALHKGKAIVAYAEALKTGLAADLVAAHEAATAADPNGTDPELGEITTLIEKHPAYPQ